MSAPLHSIFISYRRRDSIYAVDRLDERLRRAFGPQAVFRDGPSIPKGLPFPADIRAALDRSLVGLIVIGPWWLHAEDAKGSTRRIDDPADWVRIEVETLLQRKGDSGQAIPIIPVLLGGADIPRPDDLPDSLLRELPQRNGIYVRPDPDFEDSVRQLIEHVGGHLGVKPEPLAPHVPGDATVAPRLSATRLSVTGRKFVGRQQELHLLDEAWGRSAADKVNIVSLIGQGGEGKSALVLDWYSRRARHGWQGARRVFDWSFYSQGSSAQSSASADEFFQKAFQWFQPTGEVPKDPWTKGGRLAEIIAAERALLVLDGLEPIQQPPGDFGGAFKDPAMKALLRGLAMHNPGLCILTSRTDITDLNEFEQTDGSCVRHRLHALDATAARELLRVLGVAGLDREIDEAIEWFHHHAYDLNLLGNYLSQCTADHDIRGWQQRFPILKEDERIHPVPDAAGRRAGHGRRMLRAYERWLGAGSPAALVLRLLGFFDRPCRSDMLDELRAQPVIPGLTDTLVNLPEDEWLRTLAQLEQLALIHREQVSVSSPDAGTRDAGDRTSGSEPAALCHRPVSYALDAHPLLREHFAAEVREQTPEAWRAGHRRLYEYLCASTREGDRPALEDLQPLYQAVAHGCHARMQQDACDKVYRERILRGTRSDGFYSGRQLGAFGSDLGAVACFFAAPWSRVSPALTEADQGWLLGVAAFHLRALGRLTEALEPMRAGLEIHVKQEDWTNAAIATKNLSELKLALGELGGALRVAEQSVTYADRDGDPDEGGRVGTRTTHANALQQAGRLADAEARFREAEAIQAKWQPQYPLLYSLRGFSYCELRLAGSERAAWLRTLRSSVKPQPSLLDSCRTVTRRAAQTLDWGMKRGSLLDIALDHLTLGRAALYEAILGGSPLGPCHEALQHAVDGLRRAGHRDDLPRGLLTRALLRTVTGARTGSDSAHTDLDEAWQIAERGPMPLFQADIHLHRARLFHAVTPYPWSNAQADLAAARRLIEKHGYWRRKEELEDAEEAAKGW